VLYSNWKYSDAPMNYLQTYDTDFLYASGLANCSPLQIDGRPASPGVAAKAPDVSTCAVQQTDPSYADVQATQQLLNLASQKLVSISEPPLVPAITSPGAIQAGEWVSIYGSNLANTTATWTGSSPLSLGGTSVTIDARPAFLSYVSYGQINLQVPNDPTTGPVPAGRQTRGRNHSAVQREGRVWRRQLRHSWSDRNIPWLCNRSCQGG
jgi:hypothetical protein